MLWVLNTVRNLTDVRGMVRPATDPVAKHHVLILIGVFELAVTSLGGRH